MAEVRVRIGEFEGVFKNEDGIEKLEGRIRSNGKRYKVTIYPHSAEIDMKYYKVILSPENDSYRTIVLKDSQIAGRYEDVKDFIDRLPKTGIYYQSSLPVDGISVVGSEISPDLVEYMRKLYKLAIRDKKLHNKVLKTMKKMFKNS